jgi:cytochrome c peroxidase
MGNKNLDDVVAKVKAISDYQQSFKTVFNGVVTMDNIEKAIAAYERTQTAFDTAFDRFTAGDPGAINASAKRGWGAVQRQRPLHDLSRMEPDAAAVHR